MSDVTKPGIRDAGTISSRPPARLRFAAWLLRAEGIFDLSAALFIVLPTAEIQAANQFLGLDPIPAHPLTWYFIRSTSAIYAACGALLLFLSFDVVRYRPAIRFIGGWAALHGVLMAFVDRSVGMPIWWSLTEGPLLAALGLVLVWLCRPAYPENHLAKSRNPA